LTAGFTDRLDGVAATSKSLSNPKALRTMPVLEGFARLTGQKQWLRGSERSGSLVRLKPKRFRFLNAE